MIRLGKFAAIVSVLGLSAVAASCSGAPAGSRCPPEFPVEREGYCYAAEGDAAVGMDGGPIGDSGPGRDTGGGTDTGLTGDDSGGAGDDAETPDASSTDDSGSVATDAATSPDGSSVICVREHPIVEGGRRYCNAGDCFCADPDSCVPEDIASACCDVPVVCGGDAGPAVICVGEHPRITGMGSLRWCDPGNCFCASPDNCYPTDTAAACCSGPVVCY